MGQTTRPAQREAVHLRGASNCAALKAAVHKYGNALFEFVFLEVCGTQEELNEREKFWIDVLNTLSPNGYNLKEGGDCGGIPSDETRQRMSEAGKRKEFTIEHRVNLGLAHKGKKHSEEAKLKIGLRHKGKIVSEETRKRLSAAKKGVKRKTPVSAETREKLRVASGKRRHSVETRQKMSQSQKKRFAKEAD